MYFIARLNENPMLKLEYKNINIEVRSNEIADTALKTPLDKERIYKQLNKLGDTPFRLNHCHIEIDNNIIFPIKTINDLRRKGIEELVSKILKQNYQNNEKRDFNLYDVNINYTSKEIDVIVSDISQLSEVINHPVRTVYFTYSQDAVKAHRICKENNVEFGLFIPRIVKSKDLLEIKESYIYSLTNKVIVNEIGALDFFNEKNIILGTGINIYNSYSAQYLNKECILSLEMDKKQINNLNYANKIVQVYGKTENMISEFCPISQFYFNKQIKHCNKCKGTKFSLIDRKNEEFQILTDENCRMHLLNNVPLYFDDLNSLKCSHYLLHFTSESSEMVSKVMIDYFENVLPYNKSKLKQGLKTTKQYLQ